MKNGPREHSGVADYERARCDASRYTCTVTQLMRETVKRNNGPREHSGVADYGRARCDASRYTCTVTKLVR